MNPSDQPRRRARFFSSFSSPDQVRRRLRVSVRSTWRSNRLLFYSALVGVLGGLGTQLFVWMLDWGERIFSVGLSGYIHPASSVLHPAPHFGPWGVWLIPVATTLGGLLCGLLVYSLVPEAEGHGTDAAVAAYHFHGGRVRPIVPAVKAVASAITIGSGGAAGREGPTAQISVGAASILCDLLNLQEAERRILVLAGMAAGLSAIFRSPLGMAIFAVEIMYASMASEYEALPFTLVAAVVAYAVNGFFVGWSPIFLLPSNLSFTRPMELLGYAFLGVVAGIVGAIEPTIFCQLYVAVGSPSPAIEANHQVSLGEQVSRSHDVSGSIGEGELRRPVARLKTSPHDPRTPQILDRPVDDCLPLPGTRGPGLCQESV